MEQQQNAGVDNPIQAQVNNMSIEQIEMLKAAIAVREITWQLEQAQDVMDKITKLGFSMWVCSFGKTNDKTTGYPNNPEKLLIEVRGNGITHSCFFELDSTTTTYSGSDGMGGIHKNVPLRKYCETPQLKLMLEAQLPFFRWQHQENQEKSK